MTKKQILIASLICTAAAAALWSLIPSGTVREMPPDRNSTPVREQAVVQVPRPEPSSLQDIPAGPDLPVKARVRTVSKDRSSGEEITGETAGVQEYPDGTAETPEEVLYHKAMVFRDEALSAFPVYTVQVHQPETITEDVQTGKIGGENFGPHPNEIWIRIKPDDAKYMREIMAQTADLYQEVAGGGQENIVVVNWVGGQAWARMEFAPDGSPITP